MILLFLILFLFNFTLKYNNEQYFNEFLLEDVNFLLNLILILKILLLMLKIMKIKIILLHQKVLIILKKIIQLKIFKKIKNLILNKKLMKN